MAGVGSIGALRSRISAIFGSGRTAAAAAAVAARQPDSVVLVNATMNNIHVCVSNLEGQVVSKCSGGVLGYKHRQRAGALAAREIAESVSKKATDLGFKIAHVHLKGPSKGRSQILRGIQMGGLKIADIQDVTPQPTNGCRPPHMRRL